MYSTSARISGVKNLVSIGDSLVRALPVNQVKSAKAKGSAFCGLAVAVFSCTPPAATALSGGMTFVSGAVAATVALLDGSMAVEGAGCVADANAAGAAGGLPLASSSATRFSSCSMRSSIQRSRSVSGAGVSIFAAAAGLTGGSPLPSSSANATTGTAPLQNTATNMSDASLFNLKMCILLSYLFLPNLNGPAILSYAVRSHALHPGSRPRDSIFDGRNLN